MEVPSFKRMRFRIYPSPEQDRRLRQWEDALRFVWNLANEQRLIGMSRPRGERVYPSAFDQIKQLPELRGQADWLSDVPRDCCANMLLDLETCWTRAYMHVSGAPSFKKKRQIQGICDPSSKSWKIQGTYLKFPKIGNIRIIQHRELPGKTKSCTIKRDKVGDWFATIVCEIESPPAAISIGAPVAIDRGVTNVVADSDGVLIKNPQFSASSSHSLRRRHRDYSRSVKGSRNCEKARVRLAKCYRKIARQREHFLHNLSASYAKNHGTVIVEKLQIGNMTAANRGLARRIFDAGWGILVQQLRYKLATGGGLLVEMPAPYSSRTCHGCGHVDANSRKGERFECSACGLVEHADVNAALVLLQRYNTPGSPWCQPVEGTAPRATRRSRKRSVSRDSERAPLSGEAAISKSHSVA